MRGLAAAGAAGLVATALWAAAGAAPATAQVTSDTVSSGELQVFTYIYDGARNDTYQTRLTAELDGQVFYDETFFRALDDPMVQAGLAQAGQVRGVASDGAPGVTVWGELELVDSYEELLDLFEDYSVTVLPPTTVTTVQLTSGDAPDAVIYTGDRGACYDSGASGSTNYGAMDGRFASCDGRDETLLGPGELNRNTHTSYVYETVESWFTNEDWLTVSHYRLSGQVRLIGQVHAAVQTGLFEAGAGFMGRIGLPLEAGGGEGARLWATAYGGEAESEAVGRSAGSLREASGVQGGIHWARGPLRMGLAFDHGEADVELAGEPERARSELTQAGAHLGYASRGWFAMAALSHGGGEVETNHGEAALGGVSVGEYGVRVRSAGLSAGRRIEVGSWAVTPFVGADRVQVRSDAFEEIGGIALQAPEYEAERSTAWIGLDLEHSWRFGAGRALSLGGRARAYEVLDGAERSLPVGFAGTPDATLTVTGPPEGDSGWDLGLTGAIDLGANASLVVAAAMRESGGDGASGWSAGLRWRW